ncbi:MAG: PAS domain S-box protein, partial [Bacteroidota bacterium]
SIRDQERNLARSRQVNDSLLQAIPDLLLILDGELNIQSARTQSSRMQPLLETAEKGKNFRLLAEEWMTAEKLLEFEKNLQLLRQRQEHTDLEFVFQQEGADWFLELRLVSMGGSQEILAMIRDVSVRHKAQRALKESQQNYREIFDGATEGILVLEPESHQWLDGNRKARELLGMAFDETPKKDFLEWVVPRYKDRVLHMLRTALEGQVATTEAELCSQRSSEPFFAALSARFVVLGGAFRLLLHVRDISIKKATDGALAQSKTRYQTLVEKMNEGLILTDANERILFVNQRLCHILDQTAEQLMGQTTTEVFGQGKYAALIHEKTSLRQQGISDEYELELKRPNGTSQWLLIGGSPYINEAGETEGAIAIVSDITEQKKTLFKLAEKNEELDAFVYKASHDLKGPLASIIGVTNIARDEVSNAPALGYFDLISKSTKRLDLILSELIELTRINKSEVSPAPVELENFVVEIIQGLHHQAKAQNIDFQIDIEPGYTFLSDTKLLQSILGNLITNAINYHDREKTAQFVRISAEQAHNETVIKVVDNGTGIAHRMQHRVFEMFYRGSNRSKGSGLGLYIVKTSMEKLKGRIQLQSESGQGTTFTLFLPLLQVSLPQEKAAPLSVD